MSEMGNGYAEPFRQLLEVSRRNVEQATEQTLLLRQLVDSLHEVEERHRASTIDTRELVVRATEGVKAAFVSEMRSSDGWWRKAVIIIGIITTINGAGSLARVVEFFITKH